MNPYEPPQSNTQGSPFWKRLRRALGRAAREYRAGLIRDNVSQFDHIGTWLIALLLMSILFLVGASFAIQALQNFGFL